MALPVTIPNEFANATASIPLSQLDTNFNTLANAVNGISDGSETLANASVTVLTAGTVDINGGAIDGTTIGTSNAAAGSFTTLNTSGAVVFNDAGADVDFRVESDTDENAFFVEGSSGAVGIGTSSPDANLHVSSANGSIRLEATSSTGYATLSLEDNTGELAYLWKNGSAQNGYGGARSLQVWNNSNAPITFGTNNTERMVINAAGGVNSKAYFKADSYFWAAGVGNAGGLYLGAGNFNGLISQASAGTGTTTTYIGNQSITTSSDVRLKENIKPTERNALELLSQWEIVDHTWNDPSDQCENNRNSRGVWTGVVAQQVQPITPWLVNKPLEDVNEDGSINPWVMDFGYSVPLLVKAIQELKAELDTVKAELATLKGQ